MLEIHHTDMDWVTRSSFTVYRKHFNRCTKKDTLSLQGTIILVFDGILRHCWLFFHNSLIQLGADVVAKHFCGMLIFSLAQIIVPSRRYF